ncbi:MAG TPA: PHB depolymerase family esterase [Candidatus Cybelea sp.]|nr:PHB depolymerase family esterase [Candidatus Cybelea sp.]
MRDMRGTFVIALLALLFGIGVADAAESEHRIAVSGVQRSYILHLPANVPSGAPLPLVIVLHGGAGAGAIVEKQTGFDAEADKRGFVVAYPDGSDRERPLLNALGKPGFLTWNAGTCCGYAMEQGVDDVGFIRAVVADIARAVPIDLRRVYIAGHSNGAMMAYRMACEASDLVAAVGIVSGVVVAPKCEPTDPVSVIHIHGTADENVPIDGGVGAKSISRTDYPPVALSIAFWVARDDCPSSPQTGTPAPGVTLDDYGPCLQGTEVAYYQIAGGPHSWPGGERISLLLDAPSQALQATPLLWQFFAAHPKP